MTSAEETEALRLHARELDSVLHRKGLTFIIIFSLQLGKDKMLAVLFLYLMLRLIEISANFGRTAGYIIRLGQAHTAYFSAEPSASQVGATGERLMVMNEAQDILPDVYDKRFLLMATSGNATRVFSGTTDNTNFLRGDQTWAAPPG